jgi:two-component system, OmpR family, sensor histidine kinase KdpD
VAGLVAGVGGRIAVRLLAPDERMRSAPSQLHWFNGAIDLQLVLVAAIFTGVLSGPLPPIFAAVGGVAVAWVHNHVMIAIGLTLTTRSTMTDALSVGLRAGAAQALVSTVAGVLAVQQSEPATLAVVGLGAAGLLIASQLSAPAILERDRTQQLADGIAALLDARSVEQVHETLVHEAADLLGVAHVHIVDVRPGGTNGSTYVEIPSTDLLLRIPPRIRPLGPLTSAEVALAEGLTAVAGTALTTQVALREARDADRARQALLETVSHDLRGPLTTAALAIATLKHERVAEVDQTRTMEILERSVAAAAGIVDDVVALHRDADGPSGVCEVDTVLMDAVPPLADLLGRSVTLTLAAGRAEAAVPAEALRRIVENLVRNAHVHGRGETVEVHSEFREDTLRVLVRDRGPGVPTAVRERLGQPGNREAEPDADGLGLGLRIALHLARRHGGDLTVHDRAGGGAEIAVTLPLHRE